MMAITINSNTQIKSTDVRNIYEDICIDVKTLRPCHLQLKYWSIGKLYLSTFNMNKVWLKNYWLVG